MTDNAKDWAAEFQQWSDVAEAAEAAAVAKLERDGVTDDEVAAAIRQMDTDLRRIPERIRGLQIAMAVAEALVDELVDAGVEFADVDTAPTQVAASILCAWFDCVERHKDATDWLGVAQCVPEAIQWARHNAGDATPRARQLMQRHGGGAV